MCVIRGLRMEQGIYEMSLAVAINAVHAAAAPVLSLFPDCDLHTEIQFCHRYLRTNPHEKNAKATYERSNELCLVAYLAYVGYGLDIQDPASQICKALTTGANGNILQVEGIHFLVCPDAQSQEFLTHNFPSGMTNPSDQVSEVVNLREGLTFEEILHALQHTCFDLPRMKLFYVRREMEINVKTGSIALQTDKFDSLIVHWESEAGDVDRATLRVICLSDRGRYSPRAAYVPGLNNIRKIDAVMRLIAIQKGQDGRPGKIKYSDRIPTPATQREVIEITPRRRENDRPIMAEGRQVIYESEAVLNTREAGQTYGTLGPREFSFGSGSPVSPPSSRPMLSTPSMAVDLTSGDRSFSTSSYGMKTPGSSEVALTEADIKALVRESYAEERKRDLADRAAEHRRVREREDKQDENIKATIQVAIAHSLNFAFGSPDFAKMVASAVSSAMTQPAPVQPSADTAVQHNGGPSHMSSPSQNNV